MSVISPQKLCFSSTHQTINVKIHEGYKKVVEKDDKGDYEIQQNSALTSYTVITSVWHQIDSRYLDIYSVDTTVDGV